jgi:hypothetical protein
VRHRRSARSAETAARGTKSSCLAQRNLGGRIAGDAGQSTTPGESKYLVQNTRDGSDWDTDEGSRAWGFRAGEPWWLVP